MSQNHRHFLFFSFAAHGTGISGGDRIFIELAKRWCLQNTVELFVFEDGYAMAKREGIDEEKVLCHRFSVGVFNHLGFVTLYIAKIIYSIFIAFTYRLESDQTIICYSSSEFWMDSLPACILKIRYSNIRWVASWYQTAPNPIKGFREGERKQAYRLRALIYYLVQFPVKFLITFFADYVVVNNSEERKQFPSLSKRKKTIVLIGAVDTKKIREYKKNFSSLKKKYAAVFQGRFHPQKGVVELVTIWKAVVEKIPHAQLVMIGDGPLMQTVQDAIKTHGLERNILTPGYLFDGEEKYRIFAQSLLVVHPSFYDSGGMAAAEAMAFGLPCIGFDLPAYASYYPKGMQKVAIGNLSAFSKTIVDFLQDPELTTIVGREAEEMIFKDYSWDKRADEVYTSITT